MDEVTTFGAAALSRLIHARRISSREVVAAFLDRIDALNPVHNAIVSLRPREEILADADLADEAIANGSTTGPLHGLPIAIKDLNLTKRLRTTFGSPLYADFVPEFDSVGVERIRGAGAIIIGKTNTPEFGLGSHTYNPVFGITRNAFDTSRTAGGSSGGAAVAVALAMLPVADGSDFGGSLRNPAAYNNVFGFRPSQGRVPVWPAIDAYFSQLGTDGPIARNVEDLAFLLDIQAGYDSRAPLSLDPPAASFAANLDGNPQGARIGWLRDLDGHLPFEPGILDLCESSLERLETIGCAVTHVSPNFDLEELWNAFVTIRQFNMSVRLKPLYDDPKKRSLLKPEAQWEVERCLELTAGDVLAAVQTRTAWYGTVLGIFEKVDFLAIPSAQVFPFAAEKHWPESINGKPMDSYHRWMEVVVPATMSGCPVINVPVGFQDGLPMGMQIIGRPRADLDLLRLAKSYEAVLPFKTGVARTGAS